MCKYLSIYLFTAENTKNSSPWFDPNLRDGLKVLAMTIYYFYGCKMSIITCLLKSNDSITFTRPPYQVLSEINAWDKVLHLSPITFCVI